MSKSSAIRVVHLLSDDGWGGAERVISLLLKGLVSAGEVDLEVVTLNEGRITSECRSAGVPVRVFHEGQLSLRSLVRQLREYLSGAAVSVVHSHRYKEIILSVLAKPRDASLVVTVHGLAPINQTSPRDIALAWSALLSCVLRRGILVAVSPELRGRLARLVGKHVVRIPNPAPEPSPPSDRNLRVQLGWPDSARVVTFIGRLEPIKGPDQFLAVAAALDGDTRFLVVGDGSQRAVLERHAHELGLDGRISFLGTVKDPTVYFSQVDMVCLTSRHEGMPMVLLEALMGGVPTVAFDVGGVGEILHGAPQDWIVPSGDIKAFAKSVRSSLANPVKAKRAAIEVGENIRRRYGLDEVTRQYTALYHRCASTGLIRRSPD